MEATSNPAFKNFFHPLKQNLYPNFIRCQMIFFLTHQQQSHFLPGWLSLLLVYGQSSLPKRLPERALDSSSSTPSSKANPFASDFASNPIPLPNSQCHPKSSPHQKFATPFSSSTSPNLKAVVVFRQ